MRFLLFEVTVTADCGLGDMYEEQGRTVKSPRKNEMQENGLLTGFCIYTLGVDLVIDYKTS
jgi:hypothetical protein